MLVVLTTDAVADAATLDTALRAATRVSFDRLDSDGAMSTNDTVLLLASGASGVEPAAELLGAAVTRACTQLAEQLLADAEGATKEIAIEVVHAASEDDAVEVGRVGRPQQPGEDRVLRAGRQLGPDPGRRRHRRTAVVFDADAIDVAINGVWICRAGATGDDRDAVDLTGRSVRVVIDLHAGTETATILTNDLSHAYVHENSAYST